eukprot:1755812-Alexandrium_andersonii.AAC.1
MPRRGSRRRGRWQRPGRLAGLVWRTVGLLAWAGSVPPAMAAALRARRPAAARGSAWSLGHQLAHGV